MLGIFYYAKQRVFSYRFNVWYKTVLQQLFSDHCNLEQKCKKSFHLYLNEHILCALTIEFLLEEQIFTLSKMSNEIERKSTQLFPQKYLQKFRKGQPLIFALPNSHPHNISYGKEMQKRSKWRFLFNGSSFGFLCGK